MKYKLKHSELADVDKFLKNSPTAKMLLDMSTWNFEVGDVLVKHRIDERGNKHAEMVSKNCQVPKKFRVVHISEIGPIKIPWVKQILVKRGLGGKLFCLANYSHPYVKWEVDPEQVDALLLGYTYDPRKEYKQMRAEDPNYGKSETHKR